MMEDSTLFPLQTYKPSLTSGNMYLYGIFGGKENPSAVSLNSSCIGSSFLGLFATSLKGQF